MSLNAIEAVVIRNAFYKRQYHLALALFGLCFTSIIVLTCLLFYVLHHPTAPLYFATDKMGKLIKVVPLSQPNMSPDELSQWVINAVQDIGSLDYVNYREQMQSTQKYFTTLGWNKYIKAFTASDSLVALTNRRMIFEAKVTGQPVLLKEGQINGIRAWKFDVPILVSYWLPPYDETVAEAYYTVPYTVELKVTRRPILQSTDGLGIIQYVQYQPTS